MFYQSLPCVLVVDPDVAQQQVVARLLYPKYKVVWCSSCADVYGLLRTYRVSFLLLDVERTSEDPFQWIHHQRKDQRLAVVPIVCTSTHSVITQKVAAFQAGADDFIVKPLPAQTFCARMELLMHTVRMQRRSFPI